MRASLSVLLFVAFVLLAPVGAATAQTVDEPLRADIRRLMEVMGASKLGAQAASVMSRQAIESLRRTQPGIPDRAVEVINQVFDEEFAKMFDGPEGVTEQLVAIYASHFTRDDIRGLLAFYTSDLGKKALSTLPAILQESMQAGQRTAERQMPGVMQVLQKRLKDEGLIQ